MEFAYDRRTQALRERLDAFMAECVYPAEPVFAEQAAAAAAAEGDGRWERVPVTARLAAQARERGLWNLFLTGKAAQAVRAAPWAGQVTDLATEPLTNVQYAALAEITGRSPALAPEALNCAARTPGTWNCSPSSARPSSGTAGCCRCSTGGSGPRSA